MKVIDLLRSLSHVNHDADVGVIVDGEIRCFPEFAWEAKNGFFVLADSCEVVYSDDSRPVMGTDTDLYWKTPMYKDGMERML